MAQNKKRSSKSNKSSQPLKKQNTAVNYFVLLGVCLIAILIFLSLCFDVTGVAGQFIKKVFIGLIGVSAYILPFYLMIASGSLMFSKDVKHTKVRCWFGAISLVLLSIFLHIVSKNALIYKNVEFGEYVKILFNSGIPTSNGGVIGGLIAAPFLMLLDKVGSALVVGALLAFSLVMSLYKVFGYLKKWVMPFKREDVTEVVTEAIPQKEQPDYSELRAIRAAEREEKRLAAALRKEEKQAQRKARAEAFAAHADDIDRSKATIEDIPIIGVTDTEEDADTINEKAGKVIDALNVAPIYEDSYMDQFEDDLEIARESHPAPEPQTVADIKAKEICSDIDDEPITDENAAYVLPDIGLLAMEKGNSNKNNMTQLKQSAQVLLDTLSSFGVKANVVNMTKAPAVTRYELTPAPGVKISRFTNLSEDIALALKAPSVRIEAPIPGKGTIGVEVANSETETITLRRIISSPEFVESKSKLTAALGLDISGNTIVIDIAKMPHLLIAGATGSGKSVCINSLIMSILYKATPDEVKMIMVDPKQIELEPYNGIPHLISPVVTDPKKAAGALKWAVGEMMNRYKLFSETGSKNIDSYNEKAKKKGEKPLPSFVIIIDELADLMMTSPREVEDAICRLAQMARAAGMYLVIATQRPSADVITGTIKNNIPSRIAFAVADQVNSRIILDASGAEKLLGKGDMLYMPIGKTKPLRVQGCFVSEAEIDNVTQFIKLNQPSGYDDTVIEQIEKNAVEAHNQAEADPEERAEDPMLNEAIKVVVESGKASTSMLQLKLRLGYARAGRLIEIMEGMGIIGPYEGSKPRKVLITKQQWQEMYLSKDE